MSSQRTEPQDPYEANQMPFSGTVLHRDKHTARTAILLMLPMALLALLATVAVATGADPAAPRIAALIPFAWFAWTMWMVLTKVSVRTVVTDEQLVVHWGFRKWIVPIAQITSCEMAPVPKTGLPVARLATAMWAAHGTVLVRWNDANGKEKVAGFPASDPAMVAQQVETARKNLGSRTAVRVEAPQTELNEANEEHRENAAARSTHH